MIRLSADYRHYIDRRRGGEARWSLGRPADADVRIPDDLLTCPVFIGGEDSAGRRHYRATAFLISMPTKVHRLGAWAVVTARHNVLKAQREYGNVWIRVNTPDGGAIDEEVRGPWIYPDDEGVDVAAIPFLPPYKFEALPIPLHWFVTEAVIRKRQIGIGEDLVVLGLFSKHVGKARNLPIVRSGSIASMPHEHLVDEATGNEFHAYLAEVRSIGGLSGSPVFVALNQFSRLLDQTAVIDGGDASGISVGAQTFYLLGLIRGHWHTEMWDDYQESEDERLNTGIAMVSPITEVLPLVEREEFVEHRKEVDKRFASKSGMTEDWSDADDQTEYERFERLARKLVNTPKSEIDEKRKDGE